MKDKLEDFIQRNRGAFDDKEPSEKVWNNIDRSLPSSNVRDWWNSVMVWRAAAILFLALSVYLLIPRSQTARQPELAMKEFTDVEAFYIQEISAKTQLIHEFQRMEGLNGFTQDFKQLEAMYMVLKEQMKNRPSKEVKDALVLNLLVRIDLLNQQLNKLESGEYKSSDEQKEPTKNS